MAKEVLELEVKSNIKNVTKDQKDWNKELKKTKDNIEDVNEEGKEVVAEMQILGVSINGLKAAWTAAASGAKFMFRSIKAGMISTGIGAFIVALGSIATWFTQTKRGAEVFNVALSAVGATFNVIIDRVAKFGGGLVKLFTGEAKQGLKDMADSFKNIGTEIIADTVLTAALVKMQQKLRDSQRDLNVETAQQRAEIERLKLIAEDVTKSTSERLKAAKDAFNIENKLLNDRIANAEEDLRLQQENMKLTKVDGDNKAEELDREAELKINLANITAESLTKQIELNNKINAITAEGAAKAAEALQARKDADAEREGALTKLPSLIAEVNNELIQADNDYLNSFVENAEKRKRVEEQVLQAKKNMVLMGLNLAAKAGKEGNVIAKALAVRQAAIAGRESVLNTFVSASKNPISTGFPAYPYIMAAGAGLFAAAEIKAILSETPPSGSDSGGGGRGMGAAPAQTPAPQMMSGAFELTGGQAPEPLRAYVVTDEMTNSQNQLANIRRRATI
jgi:hypothetical protein